MVGADVSEVEVVVVWKRRSRRAKEIKKGIGRCAEE